MFSTATRKTNKNHRFSRSCRLAVQNRRESNRLYLRMENQVPMQNASIHYEISEDLMKPHKAENTILKDGTLKLSLGTLKKPAFYAAKLL